MLHIACILLLALAAQPLASNAFNADTPSFHAAIQPVLYPGYDLPFSVCSGIIVRGQGLDANAGNATNATYVDKYFILTAASCVLPGASCNVYLGTNEVRADAEPDLVGVTRADMVINPEFLTTGLQHSDLAILTADNITTVFKSGSKKLSAALLPSIENAAASYFLKGVSLTTWGDPSSNEPQALHQVDTRVWPNWVCSALHRDKEITDRHVCAGGLIGGGPCTGDAGAPLLMQDEAAPRVIGLATLVPTQGCGRRPGVFTRLGSYLSWIMEVTNYDPYQ